MRNLEFRKGFRVIGLALALGIGASACSGDNSSSLDLIDCKDGPKANSVTFDAFSPDQKIDIADATIQAIKGGNLQLVFSKEKLNSVTAESGLEIDTDNDNNPRFTTIGEAPHELIMGNGESERYEITISPNDSQQNTARLAITASCVK